MTKVTDILSSNLYRIIFIIGALLLLPRCNPTTPIHQEFEVTPFSDGTQQIPVLPDKGDTAKMTQPVSTPSNPALQNLIEKAKADLVQRLSVSVNEIILLEATSVTWPDASLGCPQEGMAYAQVLTPGYLIRLQAQSHEFEYHAGRRMSIVYCENPSPPVPGEPGNT